MTAKPPQLLVRLAFSEMATKLEHINHHITVDLKATLLHLCSFCLRAATAFVAWKRQPPTLGCRLFRWRFCFPGSCHSFAACAQ